MSSTGAGVRDGDGGGEAEDGRNLSDYDLICLSLASHSMIIPVEPSPLMGGYFK
jgi:hypothetical protein